MKTYEFSARVTLDGVQLYVEAESEEEARRLVQNNQWTDEEIGGASWADVRVGRLLSVHNEE